MNQDTSLGEKKADLADTDLSKIRPSPIEHREILSEFPDHPYLPSSGSRSLEDKEFQDHKQIQNERSKRYGPVCFVDMKSRKVQAPRNGKECTEFPLKEDPQISNTECFKAEVNANIGVLQTVTIRQDICQEENGTQNPSSHSEFVPSGAIYGTGNTLTKLALNYEEMNTGRHGVYTDLRYAQILHNHKDEEKLGSGSFGYVTRGKGPNGLEYVRKTVKREKFHPTEVIFTNSANHPNIIKVYAIGLDFGTVEFIMDFAGQSLYSMVKKTLEEERKSLDEDIILSLTLDICSGLDFLESKNVTHFDIKPRNLFVQGEEGKGYLLKIGDFGSAYMPGDEKKMKSFTLAYCAPEMAKLILKRENPHLISQSKQILEQRLQPKTDIFSAGLVIGFMHKGKSLLSFLINPNVSTKSEKRQIVLEYLADPDTFMHSDLIPEQAEQELKRILQGMIQFDVDKRYSANDTLEHIKALLSSRDREQSTALPGSFVDKHGEEKKILPGRLETSRDAVKKEKPKSSTSQAFLLTDDQLEGFQTNEKIGLPTHGYQTGAFMQGDQIRSSTKGNTQEFKQAPLPLEQPIYNVHVSENSYPIFQAADDLTVQDLIQKSVPGNMPNL